MLTAPRTRLGAVTLLATALACAGCHERRARPPAPIGPHDADTRIDELSRQLLDDVAAASPITATWLGIRAYDDRLDDIGPAAQVREAERLRALIDRVGDVPDAPLDPQHRLDRRLVLRDAKLALQELTETRPLERTPLRCAALLAASIQELLAQNDAPLPDRLRDLNSRLSRVRPFLAEARQSLRNPPELATRHAIDLLERTRDFLDHTLPRVYASVADERLASGFRLAQGDALRAIDDFVGWLQKDLLPRSKGQLACGKERLIQGIALREQLDTPPDVLLASLVDAGDRALKAATQRVEAATRDVLASQPSAGKGPIDVLRLLDDDHPTDDTLLSSTQAAVDALYGFVHARRLVPLPAMAPRASEMPPFLWGFVQLVVPGPFAAQPSYTLYVDPVNKSWDRKTREAHLRAFHVAQLFLVAARDPVARLALAEAARHAPSRAQRTFRDGALAAGWPGYLTQALLDAGYGDDDPRNGPRYRLTAARDEQLALCRYVGVLKLHAQGMRLDEVARFFATQCQLSDSQATREAEEVALDPRELDDGLGRLALRKLRDDVKAARGAKFSLSVFHGELLAHGTLPLGLLRPALLPGDAGSLL